jgi:hypothetical protein
MTTTFRTLLAITALFALLTTAIANGNQELDLDFSTMTMREFATARGWSEPHAVALISSQPSIPGADFDSMTLREIASARGYNQPDPVALTDLPQFAEVTIEHLADLVSFVANRHYAGNVLAACKGLYEIFESDAQMNRVLAVLTGS